MTVCRYNKGNGVSAESVSIQGVAPAQVIINEIRANEPGSSTAGEFVEIVNVGGTAANTRHPMETRRLRLKVGF